jgi:hypothetical protein
LIERVRMSAFVPKADKVHRSNRNVIQSPYLL